MKKLTLKEKYIKSVLCKMIVVFLVNGLPRSMDMYFLALFFVSLTEQSVKNTFNNFRKKLN